MLRLSLFLCGVLLFAPARAMQQPTVSLLTEYSADEVEALRPSLAAFAGRTGIVIAVESVPDVAAALTERIDAGTPPDLALLPQPRLLAELARGGHLLPLVNADGSAALIDFFVLSDNLTATVIDLGRVDGVVYGAALRVESESVVWYRASAFERYGVAPPPTWADLLEAQERLIDADLTPWSVSDDDAALTAWFENIYARSAGREAYQRLFVTGEIGWLDDSVLAAAAAFGALINPTTIAGGVPAESLRAAFDAVFGGSIRGVMLLGGLDYVERSRLGADYGYFSLPRMDEAHGAPVIVTGDLLAALSNDEAAALALRWLVSVESAALWANSGEIISPNAYLDLDIYGDAALLTANQIVSAERVLFDGSQQLHPDIARALADALRNISRSPGSVHNELNFLETIEVR